MSARMHIVSVFIFMCCVALTLQYEFKDKTELTAAIQAWGLGAGGSYGPMNTWNTASITDMSNVFHNMATFNEPIWSWNTARVTNMKQVFSGAKSFNQPIGTWNTAEVIDMQFMFDFAYAFDQPLGTWNTARVTSMQRMFDNALIFNKSIGTWNTANVVDMVSMFSGTRSFDQPIATWNTAAVTRMDAMFYSAKRFNQPIETWNTANVTGMISMFYDAPMFDKPIGAWNTASVTDMRQMFHKAEKFNQPLRTWNTAEVTDMHNMFYRAEEFNQPLETWNTAKVLNMESMFYAAERFDQSIGTWDTAKVTKMNEMFSNAASFNQPIGTWNTAKIRNMQFMFSFASRFNQPIGTWDTANVEDMQHMFRSAVMFNQPIGTWNTAGVTNMLYMFNGAERFGQSIGTWDTAKVTSMKGMFAFTQSFDESIEAWNTAEVTDMHTMFFHARKFNQPIATWNTANAKIMSHIFTGATPFCRSISSWSHSAAFSDAEASLSNIWPNCPAPQVNATLLSTSTCPSSFGTTQACSMAAVALGLPVTTVALVSLSNSPHGCYHDTHQLYFNSNGNADCTALRMCLCELQPQASTYELVGNGFCITGGSRIGIDSVGWQHATVRSDGGAALCEAQCDANPDCIGYGTEDKDSCQLHPGPLYGPIVSNIEGVDIETRNYCWRKKAPASTLIFLASSSAMPHANKMGTYRKTNLQPANQNGNRAIYRGTTDYGTLYLYYWEPDGAWRIGDDYGNAFAYVHSLAKENTRAPEYVSQWFTLVNSQSQSEYIRVMVAADQTTTTTTAHTSTTKALTTTTTVAATTTTKALTTTTVAATTTTTKVQSVKQFVGSMTLKVSNASDFIAEQNASETMRYAVAELSGVNVSSITNVTLSLASVRRLLNATSAKFDANVGRELNNLATLLINGIEVYWTFDVDATGQIGDSVVTLIMSNFNRKTIQEATRSVMKFFRERGLSKYVVEVKQKHLTTANPASSPPTVALDEDENGYALFFVCIGVAIVSFSLLSCMVGWWVMQRRGKSDGLPGSFDFLDDAQRCLESNMSEMSAATDLLSLPSRIVEKDRDCLRKLFESVVADDVGRTSDVDVFILYAVGRRPEDVDNCGPGAFYAAAVAKIFSEIVVPFHHKRIHCATWVTPKNRSVFTNMIQHCESKGKLLVLVETVAFYKCYQCLSDLNIGHSNGMDIIGLRFEQDLPRVADRWSELRRQDYSAVDTAQDLLRNMLSVPELPLIFPKRPELLRDWAQRVHEQLRNPVMPSLVGNAVLEDDVHQPFIARGSGQTTDTGQSKQKKQTPPSRLLQPMAPQKLAVQVAGEEQGWQSMTSQTSASASPSNSPRKAHGASTGAGTQCSLAPPRPKRKNVAPECGTRSSRKAGATTPKQQVALSNPRRVESSPSPMSQRQKHKHPRSPLKSPTPLQLPLAGRQSKQQEEEQFDAFMSHDWGEDSSHRNNHERVVQIAKGLQNRGIKVWLDTDMMKGDIQFAMCQGIDHSKVFAVFVTANYCKKVYSDNKQDNCRREFNYAQLKGLPTVAVPMEEEMSNPRNWVGPVGMALGSELYPANFATCVSDAEIEKFASKIIALRQEVDEKALQTAAAVTIQKIVRGANVRKDLKKVPQVNQIAEKHPSTSKAARGSPSPTRGTSKQKAPKGGSREKQAKVTSPYRQQHVADSCNASGQAKRDIHMQSLNTMPSESIARVKKDVIREAKTDDVKKQGNSTCQGPVARMLT